MTTDTKHQLAPAGAGLPKIERFVATHMIRRKSARTTREQAASRFAAQRAAMMSLVQGRDEATLSQAVLIKRLPGLEDSSRYWSLLMVMDHLRIVNRDVAEVIVTLGAGRQPDREASIAAVKPSPAVTTAVIAEFDRGCEEFQAAVVAVPDLNTTRTFPHPWFGPMAASGWHFMAGFHMQLHQKQMKRILASLPPASRS